ncbi:MAG: sugar phosphate isomerase/epimerase family protein [Vulcanimicrobiota bacterium]
MDIGFKTNILFEYDFNQIVDFAVENGIKALEIQTHFNKELQGRHFDIINLDEADAKRIVAILENNGLYLSNLSYFSNPLAGDENRKEYINNMETLIEKASWLKVKNLTTFTGYNPEMSLETIIKEFEPVIKPLLKKAGEKDMNILLENTPVMTSDSDFGNIAYSPEVWDIIFTHISDDNFGLNYDPSHLFWLGIDYMLFIRVFNEKIFHVQAKDAEILLERLRMSGILGQNWFQYRLPGFGNIEWRKFASALYENGYDGVISIEHEDPVWLGNTNKKKKGLQLSKKYLDNFVI